MKEDPDEIFVPECLQDCDIAVVAIGGGHYVPKMNDAVSYLQHHCELNLTLKFQRRNWAKEFT